MPFVDLERELESKSKAEYRHPHPLQYPLQILGNESNSALRPFCPHFS